MEIKKETVQIERMYLQCSECGRKMYGTSESQLIYNFRVHMRQKHVSIPEVENIIADATQKNIREVK